MPKGQSNLPGKKMVSKGSGKAGRKKKVDSDLAEGLGRAHAEDFLGLDDQSEEHSDEENENPVFDLMLQSEDDEAPAEEEAEVVRLQQKAAGSLWLEDFEQHGDGRGNIGETHQEVQNEGMSSERPEKRTDSIIIEEIRKDNNVVSGEEKMDVLVRDAPELVSLLSESREALDEIRNKVQPLVKKVKDGQYATKEGISYLEVKHLLLLTYCQSLVFYLLLKAEGRSVKDHPVIHRLVELRLFLEKIRPIDKKLAYQVDKLLKTTNAPAEVSGEHKEDALKYRPNPDFLVSKLDEDAQAAGGVYRPPMIAPIAMEEDVRPRNQRQMDRAEKESQRRASRSLFMKEMANELEGKPEEIQEIVGTDSREMMHEKARLDARAKEEEELFARVPLSRIERKKLKHLKQPISGLYNLLDDFDDGLADLVGMDEDRTGVSRGGPPDDLLKPQKFSHIRAESGKPAKKLKVITGDADLLVREDFGERRRKHGMRKVQPYDGDASSGEDHREFEPEGDDFYMEAKHLPGAKKAVKGAKYDREPNGLSVEHNEERKRHITNMMEKNRGPTPHRKKLTRNPRRKR